MRGQVVTSVGPEDEFARQADVRETWMECSREESVRESESEDDGVERDLMQCFCLTRWQCVAMVRGGKYVAAPHQNSTQHISASYIQQSGVIHTFWTGTSIFYSGAL